tara:strand:- start:12 stop:398 length:387 start_codon:yes stop_codon:yes gene_type:complete
MEVLAEMDASFCDESIHAKSVATGILESPTSAIEIALYLSTKQSHLSNGVEVFIEKYAGVGLQAICGYCTPRRIFKTTSRATQTSSNFGADQSHLTACVKAALKKDAASRFEAVSAEREAFWILEAAT